jgi:hypothetical protein
MERLLARRTARDNETVTVGRGFFRAISGTF